VSIEITSSNDHLSDGHSGSIESQHLQTVISGRLGEWMEMGGIDQSQERTESGITYKRSDTASDRRRLLIKVEELK
jgi:hypothetical protein